MFSDNDKEVVSWAGGKGKWEPVLDIQECGPSARFGWQLNQKTKPFTHVRLNMYPDGGIARFRLFGTAVPVFPEDTSAIFDLASAQNGGVAISCSDEHFGTKANLLLPGRGQNMGDGWETSRTRAPGHVDWTIVKLGARGVIQNFVVDTAHFRGNFPQKVRMEAICWMKDGEPENDSEGWEVVVDDVKTKGDTHVRLNMYPDGGIARFRLFGTAVPVFPEDTSAIFDLASAQNGGVAISCSDEHFGTKANLLLPGRGQNMGDGWETSRTRAPGHVDWTIVKLGARGVIQNFVVDTAHFRGNFPQKVRMEAICWMKDGEPENDSEGWEVVVDDVKTKGDTEHDLPSKNTEDDFTHIKLVIIPDGGVKRVRAFGRREVEQ